MQYWSSEIEKQVGDRVQILLEDDLLLEAFKQFGAPVLRRSSIFHGLRRFLVAQEVSGRNAFEIGTWNGLTAIVLSRFFKQVVSVDIAHNELKHEIIKHLDIENIVCIDIKDNAEKAEVVKDLHFDFAYLDGDHANDTQTDFDLVKDCGRVLFHECWPHQKPCWDLVHQLPPDEVVYGGAGLALWTRP